MQQTACLFLTCDYHGGIIYEKKFTKLSLQTPFLHTKEHKNDAIKNSEIEQKTQRTCPEPTVGSEDGSWKELYRSASSFDLSPQMSKVAMECSET